MKLSNSNSSKFNMISMIIVKSSIRAIVIISVYLYMNVINPISGLLIRDGLIHLITAIILYMVFGIIIIPTFAIFNRWTKINNIYNRIVIVISRIYDLLIVINKYLNVRIVYRILPIVVISLIPIINMVDVDISNNVYVLILNHSLCKYIIIISSFLVFIIIVLKSLYILLVVY